ncbi:MAG: hypothetical protein JWM00_328 [Candidatus Saccharibacteria bacterium]|nr:hypothetical protein [Candidatus Saccharibacteria bacterium]
MSDKTLEERIVAIEQRNSTVTLDKQWETSWIRKISIGVLTYIVVLVYLFVIGNDKPWINATVPPIGFFLSTLAVTWLRGVWEGSKQV